jgi:hypothetical protein
MKTCTDEDDHHDSEEGDSSGGTHMATSNGSLTGETVWNDMPQGGATGGGVSAVFPLPDYQTNSNVPPPSNNIGGSEPLNSIDSVLNLHGSGRTQVAHDTLDIRMTG